MQFPLHMKIEYLMLYVMILHTQFSCMHWLWGREEGSKYVQCTNMWHWVLFKIATKINHQKRWIVNFIHHAKNKLKVCAMLRLVQIAKYYYYLLRLRYNLRDIWVWSVETWRQMLMTCLDLSQQALCYGYLSHQHEMLPALPQTQQFIIKLLLIDLFSIYICGSKLHVSQIILSYSICKWIPH